MATTKDIVASNSSLKAYWILEIKRRTAATTWEDDWLDITKYLLDSGLPKIAQKLDNQGYQYGQFKTANASFKIDNSGGIFFPPSSQLSLFSGFFSRQYTKVRYRCGYYDNEDTQIDEVVFQGLLNEKTIKTEFETGEATFQALGMDAVLRERDTTSTISGSKTAKQTIDTILSGNTYISAFINYDAGNINPAINIVFDDSSLFAKRSISAVLSEIAKKTYSVWYIDIQTNDLIFKSRAANSNTPYSLDQNKDILKVYDYQEGYDKIINKINYKSGVNTYEFKATQTDLDIYGTNSISLGESEDEPITTYATFETLCNTIIANEKLPKRRIKVDIIYYPNVFKLYDKVTPIYITRKNTARNILIWNGSTQWNNGYIYKTQGAGMSLDENIIWKVLGIDNDTKNFVTTLELEEV